VDAELVENAGDVVALGADAHPESLGDRLAVEARGEGFEHLKFAWRQAYLPDRHPSEKRPPSSMYRASWKAPKRCARGTSSKRLMGLEPTTFCMAIRT
jgi:hypothetical protein